MCPTDTTPDPRDMLRAPDEPEFLQPRADARATSDASDAARNSDKDDENANDIRARPALPVHPEMTAADMEDEEADPVGDADRSNASERFQSDSVLQKG